MSLSEYNKKRNFEETAEPKGEKSESVSELIFVVQRHKASRLHYDFRLELDGVLKSWAVPKGPSMNPKDKRLAMKVEDHPYDYKDFAGIIPEGNYGAGIVEIWDSGTYADIDNSPIKVAQKKLKAGLKSGDFKFKLFGKKLRGEFVLVKLKNKEDNSWLLIKHKDEYAVETDYNSEEHTPKNSPINKFLTEKEKSKKKKIRPPTNSGDRKKKKEKERDVIKPMLARETTDPFDNENWLFEIKWDGYRAIADIINNDIQLYSRNGVSFNEKYPVVIQELRKLKEDVVLDGEIVVLDEEGKPNFQYLQDYANNGGRPLQYQVFDILRLKDQDTTQLPLLERKNLLEDLLPDNPVVRYSDHITGSGKSFYEVTEKQGLEGIMAKESHSRYQPGKRTDSWLKIKHHKTMDAFIAGYTQPEGSRKYFGALILAVKEDHGFKYIGHTGTGFKDRQLKEVYELLQTLVQKTSPFAEKIKTNTPVTWVKPQLICEVKYAEITKDQKLRHPVFLQLREDKDAAEITWQNNAPPQPQNKNQVVMEKDKVFKFGKNEVVVTNFDKVYFPEKKFTKGDIAEYYISMANYILPYLKGRPESLLRNPNGIDGKAFFHKDAGESVPDFVRTVQIHSESTDKEIDYIVCDNVETLVYLANLGCIELNPWHSSVKDLEKPDYLMIDIDPSEENTFEQVIETALAVKEILDKAGAASYCKTSGATGLHVFVPTGRQYTFEQVKNFAYIVCMLVNEQLSKLTTLERNLKKRGKDQIYLDYLQNRRGQTIASVYSVRPKKGAPVSTPLHWKEVKPGLEPKQFNIKNILKRVEKEGDLFKGVLGKGIDLKKCIGNLEKL